MEVRAPKGQYRVIGLDPVDTLTSPSGPTRAVARQSGTITGGRLRDEPSRNRSQTLWHRQHSCRKFRPDMHIQADRYGNGRAHIAFR